jgi:hypothetical protein
MEAQQRISEALPYELLNVTPPDMVDVYVQQTVLAAAPDGQHDRKRQPATDRGRGRTKDVVERSLTVTDALNRNQHLVITGEPGAGKSTLGHMYVQALAKLWLDTTADASPPLAEPVLPLRVPAKALTGNEAWSVQLATGTKEMVGRFLDREPDPELFADRPLGARWLVFVDGLDEIIDIGTRQNVIEAIAYQVRHGKSAHRLVITTRPLGWQELKPLAGLVDTYQIRPFGPVELNEFARAWFHKQDPVNALDRAQDFLTQVRDSRLRDLVGNPLLATIAAINKTQQPKRPLPSNRVDLYRQFMDHLLNDAASRRTSAALLRRSLRDQPDRQRLVDWLAARKTAIISALATHLLTVGPELFDAACAWVQHNQNVVQPQAELPAGWQTDLRELLVSSGVFVRDNDNLRFLHQSFAEFLAAQQAAAEIPAEFPDLDIWIERGRRRASQSFALFTFVLWSRSHGHNITTVLRRLLSTSADAVLLSGRMLAEGVTVTGELADSVVDRIVSLMLSSGARGGMSDNGEEVRSVLTALGSHAADSNIIIGLRSLRDRPDIAENTRIHCVIALGHLVDPAEALGWLEKSAHNRDMPTLRQIVGGMAELLPDGVDRAERLLIGLSDRSDPDYATIISIVAMLRTIDRTRAGGAMIVDLVRRLRRDPASTHKFGMLPVSSPGTRVSDVWDEHLARWHDLAELAEDAGCVEEATWAARQTLRQVGAGSGDLTHAVHVLLRLPNPDPVSMIVAGVEHQAPESVVAVAQILHDGGHSDVALELVRGLVTKAHLGEEWFVDAVGLVRAVDPAYHSEFQSMIDIMPVSVIAQHLSLIQMLDADHGHELAQRALTDWGVGPDAFADLAAMLLRDGDRDVAAHVVNSAAARGPAYWAQAGPVLSDSGFADHGAALIQRVLSSDAPIDVIADMIERLLENDHRDLAEQALDAVIHCADRGSAEAGEKLAIALHTIGRVDVATALVRHAFAKMLDERSYSWSQMTAWLRIGGSGCAEHIVADTLSYDVQADTRIAIADVLAEEGLLDAAAAIWLDVVRHHGQDLEQGVVAASRLVRCGYRDRTIDRITTALTEQLTVAERTGLRALLAWVTFSSPDATVTDLGRHLPD